MVNLLKNHVIHLTPTWRNINISDTNYTYSHSLQNRVFKWKSNRFSHYFDKFKYNFLLFEANISKMLVKPNSLHSPSLSYEPIALTTMLKYHVKVWKQLWDYTNSNRILQIKVETWLIFHHNDWLLPLLYFEASIYKRYNGFLLIFFLMLPHLL